MDGSQNVYMYIYIYMSVVLSENCSFKGFHCLLYKSKSVVLIFTQVVCHLTRPTKGMGFVHTCKKFF